MPRLEDGAWVSDRQAAFRNELLQLENQIPTAPTKDAARMTQRAEKLRNKIKSPKGQG